LRRLRWPIAGDDALSVPTVHIDEMARDGAVQLAATLCWPYDQQARTDCLLKNAASALTTIETGLTQRAEQLLRDRLSQLPPETPAYVAEAIAEKWATELALGVKALAAVAKADIDEHYFWPYGGMAGLLNAPKMEDILRSSETAGGKYGAACGELLCYIVMIDRHHSDLEPSLGLATHIMVESSDHGRTRAIPADRPRREMWQAWRGIAPYWAAVALARMAAPPGLSHHHVALTQLIANGHWLANFAVGFKPLRSHVRLLPADEAIWINPGTTPMEPAIPALSNKQLELARGYKG
jgi:hypothetical protein